jgi:hypothetical protein
MRNPEVKIKALGVASVFVLLAVVSAYGQTTVRANIPFAFAAAGKTLPAGQYDFVRDTSDEVIKVAGPVKGPTVQAMVITRLAGGMHTTPQDAHIVFDKVGEKYFLSEVWIPGVDGFLLHTTKEKHEHRIQDVSVR